MTEEKRIINNIVDLKKASGVIDKQQITKRITDNFPLNLYFPLSTIKINNEIFSIFSQNNNFIDKFEDFIFIKQNTNQIDNNQEIESIALAYIKYNWFNKIIISVDSNDNDNIEIFISIDNGSNFVKVDNKKQYIPVGNYFVGDSLPKDFPVELRGPKFENILKYKIKSKKNGIIINSVSILYFYNK